KDRTHAQRVFVVTAIDVEEVSDVARHAIAPGDIFKRNEPKLYITLFRIAVDAGTGDGLVIRRLIAVGDHATLRNVSDRVDQPSVVGDADAQNRLGVRPL